MPATIQAATDHNVVLEVRISLGRSMLDNEQAILQALNEAGNLATGKALWRASTPTAPRCRSRGCA